MVESIFQSSHSRLLSCDIFFTHAVQVTGQPLSNHSETPFPTRKKSNTRKPKVNGMYTYLTPRKISTM